MWHKHLKHIDANIYATHSAWYNDKYKKWTLLYAPFLLPASLILREELDLEDFDIVIKPFIRYESKDGFTMTNGVYCRSKFLEKAELWLHPVRDSLTDIVSTLCHECIHSEQYKTGRLKNYYEGKWHYEWEGNQVKPDHWEAPYEKEARERQGPLAEKVMQRMRDMGIGYTYDN